MKTYNQEQYTIVENPEDADKKVVLSKFGSVDDGASFVDPSSGKVYTCNHTDNKLGDSEQKQTLNGDVDAFRAAAEKAINSYLDSQYKKGKAACAVYGSDDGTITVCISGLNSNLNNFWSGGWRSTFSFKSNSKGTQDITASIKIICHYFEDGNVQLHSAVDQPCSLNVTDAEGTAESLQKMISEIESKYQSNLEEMFVDMHAKTFKAMRRFLPKTQQPMQWSTHSSSLAAELTK